MDAPKTPSRYVRDSEARKRQAGGWRLTGVIAPDANRALEALVATGYAPSRVAAIERALAEAAAREKRRQRRAKPAT